MDSKMFPVRSEGNRSALIVLFSRPTYFPCGNPVSGRCTNAPIILHGIPAIVPVGYKTGIIVRNCLARLVPPTRQILFYPTGAGGHEIISPVCASSVVYGTIRPGSLPSI